MIPLLDKIKVYLISSHLNIVLVPEVLAFEGHVVCIPMAISSYGISCVFFISDVLTRLFKKAWLVKSSL